MEIIFEILMSYLLAEALILVVALCIIGYLIKKIPKVPNWLIPFILLALGIVLAIAIMGFSADAIVQGILVTGAAVLAHQFKKQFSNALKPPDETE